MAECQEKVPVEPTDDSVNLLANDGVNTLEELQSLIKNIPSKNEPWNAPVSVWLYEMDAKQQKKTPQRQKRRSRQDTSEN